MAYLVDSDVLIYYTNGVATAHELIDQLADDGIAMSAVSYMETQQGISRSSIPHAAQARLDDLLEWVPVVAFSQAEARQSAQLREELANRGKRVRHRALDLMIAGTALVHDLVLVTNNVRDYEDISDLKLRLAHVTR